MLFNKRRQSRDKLVIEDIINNIEDTLYINNYSKELFLDYLNNKNIIVVDEFDFEIGKTYFIENVDLDEYKNKIQTITIYNWNRNYPKDRVFDINLNDYKLESEIEFVGNSHEKITKQVYKRISVQYEKEE